MIPKILPQKNNEENIARYTTKKKIIKSRVVYKLPLDMGSEFLRGLYSLMV